MCYQNYINAFKSLVFFFILLITKSVSAATFVVDDNYNGANPATACEQPAGAQFFQTIATARLAAATSTITLPHTIRICPGAYTEDNTFDEPEFIGMTIEGTTSNPNDVQIISAANDLITTTMFLREDNMTLRNVHIIGGRFGARTNLSASTVLDNLILSNQNVNGILIQSANNIITNTTVENSGRFGILYSNTSADTGGETILIQSTKVSSTVNSCISSNRGNETLIDVTVDQCGSHGIALLPQAGQPENLSLTNLKISNTGLDGLFIRDHDSISATDNRTISDVEVSNAGRFGVYLLRNTGLELNNIKIDQTVNDGINFNNTASSILENIDINNAGSDGITFNSTTENNQFRGVSILNSAIYGLFNNGGDGNSFEKLTIADSSGNAGIFYTNQSQQNEIKGFESFNNRRGVFVNNSQENIFSAGNIYFNDEGVNLTGSSADNDFTENFIHDNGITGLLISNSGINAGNAFYQNCFINPVANINNLETGVSNSFDNGSIGNFYGSVPAGSGYSETCANTDNNAVCDVPYTIPSSASGYMDNFPSRDLSSINSACFSGTKFMPEINFKKTSQVFSDPVNGNTNPKAIPGAIVEYTLEATNTGNGIADSDTIQIIDNLPANTRLVLGAPANPIVFTDGSPSSGLAYNFAGLASTTDDIQFSNNGGATFITPSVDANGIDISSPPINYLRISPRGVLNPDDASGSPNFSITFKVEVN